MSHGVVFASLRPPGGSFGAPIPISGRRATYYNLDMSSSGTAVMTWLSKRHHREKAFATARPPGGQFGRSELLARFGHRGVLYPFLDVNESGGAVIAWSGPKGDIAAVKDAGHSFRPAQLIPHSAFSTSDSSVAMAPNGTAIDIINGGPEAENVRAAIRRPGRRFKRPVLVGNHNFAFGEIAADASNHFLLLMDTADSLGRASDPVTRYYSNGSFGPPIRVFSVSPALFAVLGMNPAGDAVVSAIDNTYPATTDYVMASYGHGGQSFEQSAFLSDALTEDKGFSEATMDGAGTALVSWIDNSGALVTSVGKP
ncbi:MAG: hypothetical protein ACJ75Z_02765 [Solirubrobacterales bacterium]